LKLHLVALFFRTCRFLLDGSRLVSKAVNVTRNRAIEATRDEQIVAGTVCAQGTMKPHNPATAPGGTTE